MFPPYSTVHALLTGSFLIVVIATQVGFILSIGILAYVPRDFSRKSNVAFLVVHVMSRSSYSGTPLGVCESEREALVTVLE